MTQRDEATELTDDELKDECITRSATVATILRTWPLSPEAWDAAMRLCGRGRRFAIEIEHRLTGETRS